jgi:hypothetical protein
MGCIIKGPAFEIRGRDVNIGSATAQKKGRTYSIINTVLQLICGPKSLTLNSAPSSTPASFKVASLARGALEPFRESFWRVV